MALAAVLPGCASFCKPPAIVHSRVPLATMTDAARGRASIVQAEPLITACVCRKMWRGNPIVAIDLQIVARRSEWRKCRPRRWRRRTHRTPSEDEVGNHLGWRSKIRLCTVHIERERRSDRFDRRWPRSLATVDLRTSKTIVWVHERYFGVTADTHRRDHTGRVLRMSELML